MEAVAFKTLVDTLPGGLLITDITSRVLYANEAVSRRTGFAVAEIIGKKPGELWGGHMPRNFYEALWHTIGTEARPFVGRFDNQPKGGERRLETLQIAPVKNISGITEYFVEIHPELSSFEAERYFHQKFLAEAGEWHRDQGAWQHFFNLLQASGQTDTGGDIFSPQANLSEYIRDELILPTQARLARRFEDTTLVRAAQEDAAAFAFLYEKYIELIRQYFFRRIGTKEEADDLAQEVFVRAFRSLPKFHVSNASYYTYLLHVAHNILIDHYRRSTKSTVWNRESLELVVEEAVLPDLETLDTLLTSLSTLERSVMLCTYRDGYRAREVAERLGKSENAVKLILSRSRRKLRSVLA